MNLAIKDIHHNLSRFSLTALGIGMLLMIVMGMGGIYRGLIEEATLLVDKIGADLWVVQRETRGPFAEISRIPRNLEDRLKSMPGVATARAFVTYPVQREFRDKPLAGNAHGLREAQCERRLLPEDVPHGPLLVGDSQTNPRGMVLVQGRDDRSRQVQRQHVLPRSRKDRGLHADR
ncbi:MAG: ABC transporter permease, partial [Desulfomonilaceae bacterium]